MEVLVAAQQYESGDKADKAKDMITVIMSDEDVINFRKSDL
jgi:hypothetical protein